MTWAPFSAKALDAINNSDSFINILEGAVRSSKTVSSTIAWINFLRESPHDEFLMTGVTADTLYRNVIGSDRGIEYILGKRAQYISSTKGGARLLLNLDGHEKLCYCVGVPNKKAEAKIRGMTIGGWYADEITAYPEEVVTQSINRMSLPGARALWTMNPDSPFHYIKADYIDKAEDKGYRHWHFTLDDNLALTQDYKDNLKKAYSGLWYKRFVLGEWVQAEGVIYDMFSADHYPNGHIVNELPKMKKYWVGIDYGTSNDTVFLLIGWGVDNNLYVMREWRYSGKENYSSKTDAQYRQELVKWLRKLEDEFDNFAVEWIFVDPSAKSFITELWQRRGEHRALSRVTGAKNDVLGGIRKVASLLGAYKLFVHASCEGVKREFTLYVWDEKAQERGEDSPVKAHDHSLDSLRYVIYSMNNQIYKLVMGK